MTSELRKSSKMQLWILPTLWGSEATASIAVASRSYLFIPAWIIL